MSALACRGLHVRLGRAEVLHGIDLALPSGRWTSIVGPNGAGKSTLLKALAGLLPRSAGEIDLLARGLFAPQELPVGVLTALIGGGYLLWLMHRRGGRR